ncbi:hypothetical protein NDU88_005215 [Pleurodeles waltl]|uniref:Uncharacterized protein n=1 Tax=Pleurodeles waltl TaxID=8319 RepID=A0AAV7PG97_PLEWA|nr:hypothetical protein NDU88_005215 [Pleurodeles waltl]
MKATVKAVYVSHFGAHFSGAILQYGGGRGTNRKRSHAEVCGQDGGAKKGRRETQKHGGKATKQWDVKDSGHSKEKQRPRDQSYKPVKGGRTYHKEACFSIKIKNDPNARSSRKDPGALPTEKPVQRRKQAKPQPWQSDQVDCTRPSGIHGDSSLLLGPQAKKRKAGDSEAVPRTGSARKAMPAAAPNQFHGASIPHRFHRNRGVAGLQSVFVRDHMLTQKSMPGEVRENTVANTAKAKGLSKPKGKENMYKEVISTGEAMEDTSTTVPLKCCSSSGSYRNGMGRALWTTYLDLIM